jgi:molybdate-binding protein/DNA-binding transcriptional regulator YhcF (GntR family)
MIQITPESKVPVYEQICSEVRRAIVEGRLAPGDRLEPIRDLARQLAVNTSTVARAYRLLEQEGIVQTRQGGGTMIAPQPLTARSKDLHEARLGSLIRDAVTTALAEGYSPDEIEAAMGLHLAATRMRRLRESSQRSADNVLRLTRFAGSHDLALETLWAHARQVHPETHFEVRYVGSLDGLLAVMHGEAALTGVHLLDEESGEYNLPILRRLFVGQRICVVTLVERQQGFIVPRGNPKSLLAFADLARPGLRIINRQAGSGTRALLDHHLHRLALPFDAISGYEREVNTHLAVAEAVARGEADVGVGVLAAARALNLGFVPLAHERYDLVLLARDRTLPPLNWLLDLVKGAEFRGVAAHLGGYDTRSTGQEIFLG